MIDRIGRGRCRSLGEALVSIFLFFLQSDSDMGHNRLGALEANAQSTNKNREVVRGAYVAGKRQEASKSNSPS
jgi:hypothetical protein